MIFIASLVLLLIIKLRFPKGKSINRAVKISSYLWISLSSSTKIRCREIGVIASSTGRKRTFLFLPLNLHSLSLPGILQQLAGDPVIAPGHLATPFSTEANTSARALGGIRGPSR